MLASVWLRRRTVLISIGIALLSPMIATAETNSAPWKLEEVRDALAALDKFADRDLRDETSSVRLRIQALADQVRHPEYTPSYVSRMKTTTGHEFTLILETRSPPSIPSEMQVRINLIEHATGRPRSYLCSLGGHALSARYKVEPFAKGIGNVLLIRVSHDVPADDHRREVRQYYGIESQEAKDGSLTFAIPVLLRVEDKEGKLLGPVYTQSRHLGLDPGYLYGCTVEGACSDVKEGSKVGLLAVLTWLSGSHVYPPESDIAQGVQAKRKLLLDKYADTLQQMNDPWISEVLKYIRSAE